MTGEISAERLMGEGCMYESADTYIRIVYVSIIHYDKAEIIHRSNGRTNNRK